MRVYLFVLHLYLMYLAQVFAVFIQYLVVFFTLH